MSGGGDDPFRTYSQPDPRFASSFYPPQPPPFSPPLFDGTGSQAPPDGPPRFGTSSAAAHRGFGGPAHAYASSSAAAAGYAGSSAAVAFGGMAGPAQGYSGYGVPSPYYPLPYHAGGLPMREPARHLTSSMSGFQRGPYTFNGPYGEGTSNAGHAHFSHGPSSWNPANTRKDDMSSAAPRRTAQHQMFAQSTFASPVDDVQNTDHSMLSVGGADDLSSASSCGDNAGLVGNAADLEEDEGNGDSMGSQGEDSSMEGDVVWSSGDDSSDEEYAKLYQGLEDSFGKDNPVFKGMKLLIDRSWRTTKLLKKAILQEMEASDEDW